MKIIALILFFHISFAAHGEEYSATTFFENIPFKALPLHEMMDISQFEHAALLKAMRDSSVEIPEGKASFSTTEDSLIVKPAYGGEMEFYLLTKNHAGYLGVVVSRFGQLTEATFFDVDTSSGVSLRVDDLGFVKLYENDLLLPSDQFSDDENNWLVISPIGKGVFIAHTNGWYIPKWEDKKAAYSITFQWNGEVFEKRIARVTE